MQVMLRSTGRRTAQPREATLYAWPDGDRLVIVASKGGAPHDPAWAHNLRAEPRATLQIAEAERAVVTHEVEVGAERDRLWQLVCDAFPLYASYQRKTTRLIPLFVLDFEGSG